MLLASVSTLAFAWSVHAQNATPAAPPGKPAASTAAKPDKKADPKVAATPAKKDVKKDTKADSKSKTSTKTADKKKPAAKSATAKKQTAKVADKPASKPAVPLPSRRPAMVVASAGTALPLAATAGSPTNSSIAPAASPVPREIAPATRAAAPRAPLVESSGTTSATDVEAVRKAVATLRNGDPAEALRLAAAMSDPLPRKLTEWIVLRSDNNGASFARYNAFMAANPSWPSLGMLRRRAESMIWAEQTDPQTALAYFASNPPLSGKGRLGLARAYIARGDRTKAQALVREAWRNDALPSETEAQVREEFGTLLQHGDDKARMERRLYANDEDSGLRAAKRLGGAQLAIARLRIAVTDKASNTKALTDAVPHDARRDIGFMFAQLQLLRRADKFAEAAQLMLTVPKDPSHLHDTDEWWIERRLLARKLLDSNEPKLAYQIVRDTATPGKEIYKIESQFTAGWIALRFLNDPQTAMAHFARIPAVTDNPISLSRAGYWMGRTAEAMGRTQEARKHYESAAQWPTAYYGQIARGRLGLGEMVIHPPPVSAAQRGSVERLELVRALEILYALNERTMVVPFLADLGDKLEDVTRLAALGEMTGRHNDARAACCSSASRRSAAACAFDHYAFPTIGIPDYTPIGPQIDRRSSIRSCAPKARSTSGDCRCANAIGLMQVTPEAGQIRRQAVRRHVRPEAADARQRLQRRRSGRPNSAPCWRIIAAPIS